MLKLYAPPDDPSTEDLKDAAHERLLDRIEVDLDSGCHIFTGSWQTSTGLGQMRVAGRNYTAHRVAAWCYGVGGGFDLADTSRVRVFHTCSGCPACCCPEHLRLARGSAGVNRALAVLRHQLARAA